MVSHGDLVRLWGEAGIIKLSPLDGGVILPAGTLDVLSSVGLPIKVEPLFEAKSLAVIEVPGNAGRYCRFGSDYGTDLCVSLDTGEVLSISVTGEYPDRFVNSTPAAFVEFMVMVSAERVLFPDLDDEEIDRRIALLAERLRVLDQKAVADPDNWWSVIMEQMRDGLL